MQIVFITRSVACLGRLLFFLLHHASLRLHLFIYFSITLLICFLKIQVALVDLNQSVGEECKSDLDGHFGEDNNIFIQCDVTDAGKLRGT